MGSLMSEELEVKNMMIESINDQKTNPIWGCGAYNHIKSITNTSVGKVGQKFIENICSYLKIPYSPPLNKKGEIASQSPWDIKINDINYELKTATEDTAGGFQFNHIRYHREYQGLICLGISPDKIYFNIWSKAEVTTGVAGRLVSMEKNANASYKLSKRKEALIEFSLNSFKEKLIKS